MKRNYTGIRKVKWDQMWHALYGSTYDRVTKEEALKILDDIEISNNSNVEEDNKLKALQLLEEMKMILKRLK